MLLGQKGSSSSNSSSVKLRGREGTASEEFAQQPPHKAHGHEETDQSGQPSQWVTEDAYCLTAVSAL